MDAEVGLNLPPKDWRVEFKELPEEHDEFRRRKSSQEQKSLAEVQNVELAKTKHLES